jgi:hypothetical protein
MKVDLEPGYRLTIPGERIFHGIAVERGEPRGDKRLGKIRGFALISLSSPSKIK